MNRCCCYLRALRQGVALLLSVSAVAATAQVKTNDTPARVRAALEQGNMGVPTKALTQQGRGDMLTPDTIMAQRDASLADILAGQIAGVRAFQSDGAPGSAIDVAIRGQGSVRGDLQPLYILDGVMLNSSMLDGRNPWSASDPSDYQTVQTTLSAINPVDILSVEVIKDVSALAIYGDRGANGVVIIKTRSGARSTQELNISVDMGVMLPARKVDMLSGSEYAAYMNNRGIPMGNLMNIDWQDKIFAPSLSQNYNLNLSGSMHGTSYRLSAFGSSEQGVVDRTGAVNTGFRANLDQSILKNLRVGVRMMLGYGAVSATSTTAYLGQTSVMTALANPPYYAGTGENVVSMNQDYDDKSAVWRVVPAAYLEYKFLPFASLKVNGGIDYMDKNRRRWMGPGVDKGAYDNGRAGRSDMVALGFNADATIDADYTFAEKHHVKGAIFGSFYGNNRRLMLTSYSSFMVYDLRTDGMSLGNVNTISFEKSKFSEIGAGAQAAYIYNKCYTISGGVRGDRVMQLELTPQYYPFVNVGWTVSNECFWRSNIFSLLELTAGWGIAGRAAVEPYSSLGNFTMNDPTLWVPWEQTLYYSGLWRSRLEEFNIGLNTEIVNNINLSVKYYNGHLADKVSVHDSSPRTPYDIYWRNTIAMKRSGVEASVSGTVFTNKDMRLSLSANAAFARNTITDSGTNYLLGATNAGGFHGNTVGMLDGDAAYVTAFVNGYAPGVFYGYKTQGIVGTQHVQQTPPFKGDRLQVGDVKFIDVNGDGQVDRQDMVVIGNPNPKAIFGFNACFDYKRWQFAVRMDGTWGNDVLNLNRVVLDNVAGTGNISHDAYNQAQNGTGPRFGAIGLNQITDRMIEDGSNLRLSQLLVSYSIPFKKQWISALDVSLMASNLFVISGYSGYDPMVSSFAGDWSLRGVDLGSYPRARFISLGLSARF